MVCESLQHTRKFTQLANIIPAGHIVSLSCIVESVVHKFIEYYIKIKKTKSELYLIY